MAPAFVHSIRAIVSHASDAAIQTRQNDILGSSDGPLAEAHRLLARDEERVDNHKGVLDPHDINNVGFFVLFALLGVAFVLTGIWFFFWAKNGGFYFKENDWDDYKTTVLRRRGPNGTILSNATASTKLGGGSVYKDVDDDGTTVITESTALSGITAGASDIGAREARRKKQEKRDRERKKRHGERRARRHVGDDGVEDEVAEKEAKQHLRSYRHERPARVGGLNKESEGSNWDGSTNPSESIAATSELLSHRESTPPRPTAPPAAIRKVYSTADRNAARENERMRAEARRLREEARSSRRDFSYTRGGGAGDSTLSESLLESNYSGGTGSELGTKSYHHPMPELRAQREREREERRARRGGYRRGRGEDSDI
ncbi:hypothetical protein HJFPF1_07804 [Paramyrothecium foliicola]|nr:hypothetical protein HJFPF1_07804 [Paramyrothecium foliicola]